MDAFLVACGASEPWILEVEGPGRQGVECRRFERPCVIVGRDPSSDLVIPSEAVGPRQLYLQIIEGRLFVVDLGNPGISHLPDGPIVADWLPPRVPLRVGPFVLRLAAPIASCGSATQATSNPLAEREEDDHWPGVALEFRSRSAGEGVWPMGQTLALVGQSPRCTARLLDNTVGRFQCALLRTPMGLWVVDLLGPIRSQVNGVTVPFARLGPGDVLKLGRVLARPIFEEVASPPLADRGARDRGLSQSQPAIADDRPSFFDQPTAANADGNTAGPTVPDPAMAALVERFESSQRRMAERYEQTLSSLFRSFEDAQREQLGSIREELRRLSNEVARLNGLRGTDATTTARLDQEDEPDYHPLRTLGVVGPGEPPAGESQEWLDERLALISQEQQSRWEKVRGLLRGGAAD